jgi:LysR family transcriptional activator of nhaA
VLLPSPGTALRRALEAWFTAVGVQPAIAGEFDDSALMMAFGARGSGVFAVPRVLEDDVRAQHGVQIVGRAEDVREAFYAITVERRLRHPAVVAVAETARDAIFGAHAS